MYQFEIGEFFRNLYTGVNEEIIYALFLDNSAKKLRLAEISRGTFGAVTLDTRRIVETAMRMQATSVILAHNHPKGFALPSSADVDSTRELYKTLKSVDIRLDDHIVVGADDHVSMRLSAGLEAIFK